MSRSRHPATRKIEAVRRVVEDGRRVCDVAREAGVGEGSLFFWVRRYREFAQCAHGGAASPRDAGAGLRSRAPSQGSADPIREAGTLVAYLRHAKAR